MQKRLRLRLLLLLRGLDGGEQGGDIQRLSSNEVRIWQLGNENMGKIARLLAGTSSPLEEFYLNYQQPAIW